MPGIDLHISVETLYFAEPFRISGYVFESQNVVVATIADGDHEGRGEAAGVYYLDDNASRIVAGIESVRSKIEAGAGRAALQHLLGPGGARNALDCALWELDARRHGTPVWKLAGLDAPKPLVTTFTVGAGDPEAMARKATSYAGARAIKIKLTGELALDLERVRAVREARPDVWLSVDANQGFARDTLERLIEGLAGADVSLLEQPLPRGHEAALEGVSSPIPIAADESVLSLADMPSLEGRFDTINIKLDKCGGLTEGLAMARKARALGLGVMVGNMVGTSRAMAPAFLLGQLCDVVDLDGPTFLTEDISPAVSYADGKIRCGEEVWGLPPAATK